jgi:hypothetical protein
MQDTIIRGFYKIISGVVGEKQYLLLEYKFDICYIR